MSVIAARNAMTASGKKKDGPYWGLCFTAEQAGSTVAIVPSQNTIPSWMPTIMTSIDGGATWSDYTVNNTVITLANIGDKVWFKAGEGGNSRIGGSLFNPGWRFSMTGLISADGEAMSLINGDSLVYDLTEDFAFNSLFQECACLISAPKLSATTLGYLCYQGMFRGCTSLMQAPILPATVAGKSSYNQMFRDCPSLKYIKVLLNTWANEGGDGFNTWVTNVASTGTFVCPAALGTNSSIARGTSYCPSGWTVINDV